MSLCLYQPVQSTVCDSLHHVEMFVCPIYPFSNNVHGYAGWVSNPGLDQLKAIATIHEGTLQFHVRVAKALGICEEHVPGEGTEEGLVVL